MKIKKHIINFIICQIISLLLFLTFTSCEKENDCRPFVHKDDFGNYIVSPYDNNRYSLYCGFEEYEPVDCGCDTTLYIPEYNMMYGD